MPPFNCYIPIPDFFLKRVHRIRGNQLKCLSHIHRLHNHTTLIPSLSSSSRHNISPKLKPSLSQIATLAIAIVNLTGTTVNLVSTIASYILPSSSLTSPIASVTIQSSNFTDPIDTHFGTIANPTSTT